MRRKKKDTGTSFLKEVYQKAREIPRPEDRATLLLIVLTRCLEDADMSLVDLSEAMRPVDRPAFAGMSYAGRKAFPN